MSSVLTLNGGVLVTQNGAPLTGDATTADIQASKSYTVAASGNQTISPDTGYDAMEAVSLSVPAGTATAPASISGTSASVTTGTNTLTLSKTVSNTPRITTAGYISSGTAGNSSVSLTANVNIQPSMIGSYVPSTTQQTIAANTYFPSAVYILPVTTNNLTADNIKKNVTIQVGHSANAGGIASVTGTYEGSGSSVALKMGVVRPDAELLQTWSGDYLLHTDKGITIPSYSTTATTLFTGGTALTPTVTLSNANYRYYLIQRFLTIPQYSITTLAKGRQEYTAMSMCYEIVAFPANTFSALVNTTKYGSRNTAVLAAGNAFVRNVYWSSGTALSVYTANTYGCAQTIQTAPSISSGTAASPTLTVYDPNATIRGSTTYLVNTFYNAITDIRCQYVIQLYRIPASTTSTYGMDGWGHYTQMLHNITCAQSSTHKLT